MPDAWRGDILTAVLILLALGGCAVAPAAILPTAAGTAPVVVAGWGPDNRVSFWIARYDDVLAAAHSAGETLALTLESETVEDGQAKLTFADDGGKTVRLGIERRSKTVTRITIDSDLTGMASLFGRQIVDELQKADAFLVDWSEETERTAE